MSYRFDGEKHIHFLDEEPLYGTSTLIKEVMPPFLAKWGAQCAVDWLRSNPGDERGAVLAYNKVRDKAADKGTDMHGDLEKYIKSCIETHGGAPVFVTDVGKKVSDFSWWAVANVKTFLLSEAHAYSKALWVGGIIDCVARLNNGRLAIIDFKSSKEAYYNQVLQAAGYAIQYEENGTFTASGTPTHDNSEDIGELIILPFGGLKLRPEHFTNVAAFKDAFSNLLPIYKLQQAFKKKT